MARVIFTIKDYEDRLIAQAITTSIMITDDHKTHAPPSTSSSHTSHVAENAHLPGAGSFNAARALNMQSATSFGPAPFRLSHSTTDLQGLRHNFNPLYVQPPPSSVPPSQFVSQATSATMTPRNLSRQASPSGPSGPSAKKRKASGPTKVPTGLAMTKLDSSGDQSAPRFTIGAPGGGNAAATAFPPGSGFGLAITQPDRPFGTTSIPAPFTTAPTTPNNNDLGYFTPAQRSQSMENLPLQQMFSAPSSARPSRAPSPTSASRMNANASQIPTSNAQMAQAVANSLYGVPLALNPHRPPTIHKLIPSEGPRAGGIEVTCLGSGFCQGLEVLFGDAQATTTTFWGDASLVCLLPPAAHAGSVPVTFKHERLQQLQMQQYPAPIVPKQQIQFKYLDDDEQQLLKLALNIVGHKMTGRMEDAGDVARRIVTSGPNTWGGTPAHSNIQHRQASGLDASMFGALDLEASLLACLDFIDLDDSPYPPRLNLRGPTGHTVLHYAASLGLHRFAAGLLARGANPDVRDRGGYTPMHYASLHNHSRIVRRLRLAGGDPTIRSLRGFTPADLAASPAVLESTRSVEWLARMRGSGTNSPRSRPGSASSIKSLWDVSPAISGGKIFPDASTIDGDDNGTDDDGDTQPEKYELGSPGPVDFWTQSRRNSDHALQAGLAPIVQPSAGLLSPTVAMTAWRDQLSAQIQHFQQSVLWTLPNLQMPGLPPLPNLPSYQAYPVVRRISSLVPHRSSLRPSTSSAASQDGSKEGDYGWWELLTGSPSAPPAYDEIYPDGTSGGPVTQKTPAVLAAAEATLDQKCSELFDGARLGQSSQEGTGAVQTMKLSARSEQHEQMRLAHAKKVKRIQSDRNLFFIWVRFT